MANIELDRVCDVRDGTHDSPKSVPEGYPLVTSKNIVDGLIDISNVNFISEEDYKAINKRSNVDHGDILMPMIGTIGGTVIVNKEFEFAIKNVALIKFHKDSKVTAKYIKYVLDSNLFLRYVESENRGNTQKFLSLGKIRSFPIPLISLERQSEITSILDNLSQTIKKRKEQIELFDVLIKSRFVEMFGDPVSNPNCYTERTLNEIGVIGRGVSKHRPRNASELLGGKYPLIQTGDVANADLYITEYMSTYSEMGLKQSKLWDKGTLCITIAANIAKTSILNFDACFPDSVVGFVPNGLTNNIFMHFWFSFFQKLLESQAPESAQKNINLKILNELKVIVPPIDEQNEFAEFVQQVDKLKFEVQKSLNETQILFDLLMQKYFD